MFLSTAAAELLVLNLGLLAQALVPLQEDTGVVTGKQVAASCPGKNQKNVIAKLHNLKSAFLKKHRIKFCFSRTNSW
jgi:hypothetical protein